MSKWIDSEGYTRLRNHDNDWPDSNKTAFSFINNAQHHLLNRGCDWHTGEMMILNDSKEALNNENKG